MAQYLILLYEDESGYADATPELRREMMEAHGRFQQQVGELGAELLGGQALEPVSTATSIRADALTDGPFVETKENIGGYYLVEAKDLDQALAVGRLVPARFGGVEVRPVMDLSKFQ
ncbi:MAG TPA: YciI family protein [Pseudonocardiaceae bacterium]|nr:YciI family protein [Pseudonocardiaceae bacterium]